jgi:hypothetical protein|nr:MAG TPA: hypothetical protein [Caudoviricetes sp.]
MEIKLVDTKRSYTINGKDYVVNLGDPVVLEAHDEFVDYLQKQDETPSPVESVKCTHDFLKTAFGDVQFEQLGKIGALDTVNSQRLATALMHDVKEFAQENSYSSLLEEFGLE